MVSSYNQWLQETDIPKLFFYATPGAANKAEVEAVKAATQLPVLVSSGITIDNVADFTPCSDALIIGSWFKKDGHWANELDMERVERFMAFVGTHFNG